MGDDDSTRNYQTVIFHPPFCRPGTPEAQRHGCVCRFESNLRASIYAAEHRKEEDTTIVVIHEDCPLHEVVPGVLGPGGQQIRMVDDE